jgi:hypothetical protein
MVGKPDTIPIYIAADFRFARDPTGTALCPE